MIVKKSFFAHWKTKRLIELGGESTIICLQKLWLYAEEKRSAKFVLAPRVLASVCEAKIKGEQLLSFFVESGFVEMNGETLIVHDWEHHNKLYSSAWNNGKRGGRPVNRADTDRIPTDNRRIADGQPSTRARVGLNKNRIDATGYRPVSDNRASDQPLAEEFGPLAWKKEGKGTLKLLAERQSDKVPLDESTKALNHKKFAGLMRGLAETLKFDKAEP